MLVRISKSIFCKNNFELKFGFFSIPWFPEGKYLSQCFFLNFVIFNWYHGSVYLKKNFLFILPYLQRGFNCGKWFFMLNKFYWLCNKEILCIDYEGNQCLVKKKIKSMTNNRGKLTPVRVRVLLRTSFEVGGQFSSGAIVPEHIKHNTTFLYCDQQTRRSSFSLFKH